MSQSQHHRDTPAEISALQDFVAAMTTLVEQPLSEQALLDAATPLLARLVARDDWLPEALARPHPQFYRQYALHVDPQDRFSVVSFVWGPGQTTPVHDHTVWGLIGMLRGEEIAQPYRLDEHGKAVPDGEAERLRPGDVAAVSPRLGDVHRVSNAFADRTSISIHVYGANIGAVQRWVYPPEGGRKPFVSGYSTPAEFVPVSPEFVRTAWRERREVALIDLREEDPFAQSHPLFAAQLSLSRLELDTPWRLPRRDVPVVLYDDGEGLVEQAGRRLRALGYTQVFVLEGGLAGWRDSGAELFRDVNSPSKAFGELVEHERHTPSLAAEEVKALLDEGADVVVLDARRFDEYQTMSIPTGTSVPGAELALRVRDLAPDPKTRVIVNCAGRTRSIIGTQSLVNAGIPNPVSALRNGTIGWTLAGFALDHGQSRHFGPASEAAHASAREAAQALARRAGVERLSPQALDDVDPPNRTVYRYDVRSPEEYAAGHLPGFGSAPGGQLVQETDVFAPVRGARIVLVDDDGVRAPMTAHWLAQQGWDVAWIDGVPASRLVETAAWPALPDIPAIEGLSPAALAEGLARQEVTLIDLTTSARHVQRHIPGAWWALRSQLPQALARIAQDEPAPRRFVLTCGTSALARLVARDLAALTDIPVQVLEGGNAAWFAAGLPAESGEQRLASPRIDRYRRPYEGTDNPREAMQGYLDWEYGLVAQLAKDGTHGFKVLGPESHA